MSILSLHSPVGDLTLFENDGALVALEWGWSSYQEPTDFLKSVKTQLDDYFDGTLTDFDVALAPEGTYFQKRVWQVMSEIPYGKTLSYGEVADQISSGPRPVGTACGKNAIPIIIPCHRILAAGGKMGGYSGDGGLETKEYLLRLEGALL